MKQYAKNALGYVLKAPKMVRMPMKDASREKRLGTFAIGALVLGLGGTFAYRTLTPAPDAVVESNAKPLALVSDTATKSTPPSNSRFSPPNSTFAPSSTSSSSLKSSTGEDRYATRYASPSATASDLTGAAPATLPSSATSGNPLRSTGSSLSSTSGSLASTRSSSGPTTKLAGTVAPAVDTLTLAQADSRVTPTSGTEPVSPSSTTPAPTSTAPLQPVPGSTPVSSTTAPPTTTAPTTAAPFNNPLSGSSTLPSSPSPTTTGPQPVKPFSSGSLAPSTSPAGSPQPLGSSQPLGTAPSTAASPYGAPITTQPSIHRGSSQGNGSLPSGPAPTGSSQFSGSSIPPSTVPSGSFPSGSAPLGSSQPTASTPIATDNNDRYNRPLGAAPTTISTTSPQGTQFPSGTPTTPPGSIPNNPYGSNNFNTPVSTTPVGGNPYGNSTPTGPAPTAGNPYGSQPTSQQPYGAQPTSTQPLGQQPLGSSNPYGNPSNPYGNTPAPTGFNGNNQFSNPNNPTGLGGQPGGVSQPSGPLPTTVTLRDGRTIKVRPYRVKAGDTLFDIARYELGKASRWSEIFQINQPRLGDGLDYLAPGMDLLLPETGTVPNTQPGGRVAPSASNRSPLSTSRDFPTAR
jgi:hypothetical protein